MSDTIEMFVDVSEDSTITVTKVILPDRSVLKYDPQKEAIDFNRCRDFIGCDLVVRYSDNREIPLQVLRDVVEDEKHPGLLKLVHEDKPEPKPVEESISKNTLSMADKSMQNMAEGKVGESLDVESLREVIETAKDDPEGSVKENGNIIDGSDSFTPGSIEERDTPEQEMKLMEEGKLYALLAADKPDTVVAYCRVDYIEQSQILGHKKVTLTICSPGQPSMNQMDLPLAVLNVAKPVAMRLPMIRMPILFAEVPLLSKEQIQTIAQQAAVQQFQQKEQNPGEPNG